MSLVNPIERIVDATFGAFLYTIFLLIRFSLLTPLLFAPLHPIAYSLNVGTNQKWTKFIPRQLLDERSSSVES